MLNKKNICNLYGLTPLQEGMLYHYLEDPSGDLYFEQLCLTLEGRAVPGTVKVAWDLVARDNAMLRTLFRWEKLKNPVQVELKDHPVDFRYIDLSNSGIPSPGDSLARLIESDKGEKLDLREVPFRVTLCKLAPDRHEMIVTNHHILYDGWSNGILLREFFDNYGHLAEGRTPAPRRKSSFKEYVRFIQSRDVEKERTFWRDYLGELEPGQGLSVKRSGERGGGTVLRKKATLPSGSLDKLESRAKELKITPASLVYAGWGLLLQKYNGKDACVFGTTVSGRSVPLPGIEDQVGLFINTLPLKAAYRSGDRVRDYVKRVHEAMQEREAFEVTPLVSIGEYCGLPGGQGLFDTLVVVENYPLDRSLREQDGPLSVTGYSMVEGTNYDLTLSVTLEQEIVLEFIYNSQAFEPKVIEDLPRRFETVLMETVSHPGKSMAEIDLLTKEERRHRLEVLAGPGAYPVDKTIPAMFMEQVEKTPGALALAGTLSGGERVGVHHFTYRELDRLTGELAGRILELGMDNNELVALESERRVEMIIGMLGILKAGCGYVPLNPAAPVERNEYIMKECGVRLLLTTRAVSGPSFVETQNLGSLCSLFSGDTGQSRRLPRQDAPGPSDIAYVIFTSGSTGLPKGVAISHANFCPLMHWGYDKMGIGPGDRVVQNLSYYFDWSVWEIFITLTSGAALFMVPRETMLDAVGYAGFMRREHITVLHITPTQFLSLVDCGEKLVTLEQLAIGAEKLTYDLVERTLLGVSESCRVYNMYGPTEATIMSAVLEIDREKLPGYRELSSVPIGDGISNLDLLVLDKDMRVLPPNVPGELFIGGDGVSPGYINNPELTDEKFIGNIYTRPTTHDGYGPNGPPRSENTGVGVQNFEPLRSCDRSDAFDAKGYYREQPQGLTLQHSKLYRTGDRVRQLADGTIEFLGRVDFQVKMRGFRIEPGEIETQLLKHPAVKETVVIAREDQKGEKYLCAYFIQTDIPVVVGTDRLGIQIDELREFLSGNLPDYMVPSYFVSLEKFPLNANGKIDLAALPAPGTSEKTTPYLPPRDDLEGSLVDVWTAVLGGGEDTPPIGIDDNFFELGGHSLKASRLVNSIHKELDVAVPLGVLLQSPSVRGVAEYIRDQEKSRCGNIPPAAPREYYPLSSAQKRMFVLQQMESDVLAYNMTGIMELTGELDPGRLTAIFRRLIERHESLRTSFSLQGNEPVQRIHEPGELAFEIEYTDLGMEADTGEEEAAIRAFVRPFDLGRAPLLRSACLRSGQARHLLAVDMHHIVSDGYSLDLFIREFIAYFKGETPGAPVVQYKDYVCWALSAPESHELERQEAFWLEQFAGEVPVLNLPTDYVRPLVQEFSGAHHRFILGSRDVERLRALARRERTTPFVLLFSTFNIFLYKLTHQEDIVVGTVVAGRRHPELSQVLGMFVNTLGLRNFPFGKRVFSGFTREVGERLGAAFDNQDYPFEDLVEKTAVKRDVGRNPLFDVVFAMHDVDMSVFELPGIRMRPYDFETGVSKFDLTFNCENRGGELLFEVEYATRLFSHETIEKYSGYFSTILSRVLEDPDVMAADIDILPEEERAEILFGFNGRAGGFPNDITIPELFAARVEKTPHRVALAGCPGEERGSRGVLTYEFLDRVAARVTGSLMQRGLGRKDLIGVMADRGLEMIYAILGILKAGCGYVPLNPTAPLERNEYIMKECGVRLLLASGDVTGSGFLETQNVASLCENEGQPQVQPLDDAPGPGDIAYVIYTSGSTGLPKGVAVSHGNFCPLMFWGYDCMGIGPGDRVAQNLSYYFDWSVWEIFIALTSGAGLFLVSRDLMLDPGVYMDFLNREGVTVLNITPTQFQSLVGLGQKFAALEHLAIGAEKLTYDLASRAFSAVKAGCRVYNMYGPTEATIMSAVLDIDRDREDYYRGLGSVPIGVPISNLELLVLDRDLNLCPVNIPGELYIAGDGVAHGYVNNPELTHEKFIPNSFVETQNFASPDLGDELSIVNEHNKLYRTGDLARWLSDGTVEFLGRIDQQVKIRGFRIELGEIENRLLAHNEVKEAVVIDREDESTGEKYLCAYIVPAQNKFQQDELRNFLSQSLPDYMVPAYFVAMATIPLNANGKVDRGALPEPDRAASGRSRRVPRDRMEEVLAETWARVLGKEKDAIGIDDNFFEIGGHSLKATLLIAGIEKEFNVKLRLTDVFKHPTLGEMAGVLKNKRGDDIQVIQPAVTDTRYPVSSAQKRLYILQQRKPGSTAYNMPLAAKLSGNVDADRVRDALRALIDRHESLRTYFEMTGGELSQRVLPMENVDFQVESPGTGTEVGSFMERFIEPFDLSLAPLIRAALIRESGPVYVLLLDVHHIVSDGRSIEILLREFMALYAGEDLPPLRLQYKDYCSMPSGDSHRAELRAAEAFWMARLAGEIPRLNLPLDFPRSENTGSVGKTFSIELDKDRAGALRALALEEGVTLYMLGLAVFNVLLAKLTGREDVIVATPVFGRRHAELENVVGMFINTLVLRNRPNRDKGFDEFLEEVYRSTLQAFENQAYPFEDLVEKLEHNDPGAREYRNPLFDVVFAMQNLEIGGLEKAGVVLSDYGFRNEVSKFDLALNCLDTGDTVVFSFEYKTRLFKEETIKRFSSYLEEIIDVVLEDRTRKIKDIKISLGLKTARPIRREVRFGF